MLGKSVGPRVMLVGLLILLLSCAHKVSQDKKTGEDGKSKGAKELTLENNEVRDTGIVTYPGGDRVDWKLIEVPEKQRGSLDIRLTWRAPRPGLQLAFDVYDEWGKAIGSSKKKRRSRGRRASKVVEVAGKGAGPGEGKYLIRVYAVGRGDAGKYRLVAEFKEENVGPIFNPLTLDIPDPPKLAAVPEPEVPCDLMVFDKNNPSCIVECPMGAPPSWPGCKDVCPTPVDPENPACQRSAQCPKPPDRRFRKCKASAWPKCPDIANPDPENPNCDNAKADPVRARVLGNRVSGGDLIIQIAAGSSQGVAKTWRGQVMRGDSNTPLPGGDVIVIRVDKTVTVGKVGLTTDQIGANPYVKLSPP